MLLYVTLKQIEDNPFQARQEYGDIEELAGRIAAAAGSYPDTFGLMQVPRGRVVFRNATEPDGRVLDAEQVAGLAIGKYLNYDSAFRVQLAFGHRRLRAFRYLQESGAAGYADGIFPVHLDALSDEQMLDAVWAENRERKDISAVEEAELMQKKLARAGSQREVADAWGLARPTVANRLRLLQLPPEVQQANRAGLLPERTAQRLLKVVELQTAVNGADWQSLAVDKWRRTDAPGKFLSAVVKNPEKYTSDDVDKYVKDALAYVGRTLPDAIARHAFGCDNARQAQCKGCPARVNQSCLDGACLEAKKAAYREDIVAQVAAELGVAASHDEQDFLPAAHESAVRDAISAAWERRAELPDVEFVVGWRDGYGLRPFRDIRYLYSSDAFDGDGRAGIVLGVRGGSLPEQAAVAVTAATKPAEDIASVALQRTWSERAAAIVKRAEKAAKAALTEIVAYELGAGAADALQALVADADKEWIDSVEVFARKLTEFCLDCGRGICWQARHVQTVGAIRAALTRAGLQPDVVLSSGVKAQDLADAAVLALDFWYRERYYHPLQDDIDRFRGYALPLLAGWPADGGEELDQLHSELQRALRDAQAKEKALAGANNDDGDADDEEEWDGDDWDEEDED